MKNQSGHTDIAFFPTTYTLMPNMKLLKFLLPAILILAGSHIAADAGTPSPYLTDDGKYILTPSTTLSHFAIVEYGFTSMGISRERKMVDIYERVEVSPEMIYAYCPKTSELLYSTPIGNYSATATSGLAKLLKKDKRIAQLKPDEMNRPKQIASENLQRTYREADAMRQKAIDDSLQAEAAYREQERIRQERRDHEAKVEEYRAANAQRWCIIASPGSEYCYACHETHSPDSILLLAIMPDYWVYQALLEPSAELLHTMKPLKENDHELFFEAFADSLKNLEQHSREIGVWDIDNLSNHNSLIYQKLVEELNREIRQKCPWGYISDWDWDENYGNVSFSATFNNTSAQTIKYIEFHFVITNDVNDRRCSGVFKGTGPVGEWETGSWEWDSSRYWVGGDATRMQITKVVLTYMNGKQKILTGKQLTIYRE